MKIKFLFIALCFTICETIMNAQWVRQIAEIDTVGSLTPVIDGNDNDSIWKLVPENKIERLFANDSSVWNKIIGIDKDMSGYWKAAWSNTGLYILVKTLSDDTIPLLNSYGESWEQERIQIYFDLGIDSLADGKSNSTDGTYHPLINVTRYTTAEKEIAGFPASKVTINVNNDYSGAAEFYVPWTSLKTRGGVAYIPSKVQPIGFDVILVDNDGPLNPPARSRKLWCSFVDPYFDGDSIGRISFKSGIDTIQYTKPYEPEILNVENFKIIGYLPSYRWGSISKIDWRGITHINISFANPSSTGNLNFAANISTLQSAIDVNKTKIMLSIGGGAVSEAIAGYYKNLLKDANRADFIDKLLNYAVTNSLNGIDVDLEGNLVEIPEYNVFVKELAAKLHQQGMFISIAIPNWSGGLLEKATYDSLDWINVMSYDATGPWAPASPGPHASYSKYLSDFSYFNKTLNIHGSKIVMGMPFYGYEFVNSTTANTFTFADIVKKQKGAELLDVINGNLYYNGIPTITKKTEYMKKYGAGVMVWELGQDSQDSTSLLRTVYNAAGVELPVFINNIADLGINIYPNPFNDILTINLQNENTSTRFELFNLMGEKVVEQSIKGTNESMNFKNLSSGIYILKIHQGATVNSFKVVKK